MSLYHHVPNKAALLRGVTNLVARQFRPKSGDGTWQEQLHSVAHGFRALAHQHPNLIEHSFANPSSIDREDPFWTALTGILHTAGVPPTDVAPVAAVITSLFSGYLIAEVNGTLGRLAAMQPALESAESAGAPGAVADGDRGFELAMQTLILGLEAQLTRGRQPGPGLAIT
ncbi:TetR/AcrR family transcriptional regulator C-terminal domain-containing protein [Dactylosporangium darangshiense]